MGEPPKKRSKRTDSTAMWEKEPKATSPRSPRPYDESRDEKPRRQKDVDRERDSRSQKDDRGKRRSRSPEERESKRERRERERERDRDRDRDRKERHVNGGKRERSRSRDRDGDKDRHSRDHKSSRHDRHRSRSRSPVRNGGNAPVRTRSPPRGPRTDHDRLRGREKDQHKADPEDGKKPVKTGPPGKVHDTSMDVDEDDEDALLKRMMGFGGFKSTKNTKVPGNQIYAVRKEKKTEYRQYMNRVGGFNRPLSPSRD